MTSSTKYVILHFIEDEPCQVKKNGETDITKLLVGRKIVAVRYMNDEEMENHGWYNRALLIQLDDGTVIYPSRYDEGSGAGALFTNSEEMSTIPVI